MSTSDSLVLAGMVELLLGGQKSAHPMCPGAKIILQPGFDRGAGAPQTEVVASLLLDGSRPTGRRTDNRVITLPIVIHAPNRAVLNGAKELLLDLVDQPKFQLQWTPDPQGGTPLPLIFDCFRATEATAVYDQDSEDELVGFVKLTFPALPFGRSDEFTTLPFPSPAVSWATPPSPVRLDDLSTVSSTTQTGDWSQSPQAIEDSHSARWNSAGSSTAPLYTRTLAAPVSIAGLDRLTFNLGLGTSNYTDWHNGRVTFAITLTDSHGHKLPVFGNHVFVSAGNDPDFPLFQPVTFAIPDDGVFDFTAVAAWSVNAWRRLDWFGRLTLDADTYINGVTATASAAAAVPLVRGTTYQIGAPGGTARTLMGAQFQPPLPPVLTPQTVTFTTPGPFAFTPPVGSVSGKVRVQSASGVGGTRTTAGPAGGGGGGAVVGHDTYAWTPGQPLTGFIGAAGARGAFPVLTALYTDAQDAWTSYDLVTPSFTPAAGEVIVVKAIVSSSFSNFATPVGGGLSFASQVNNAPSARVRIWTATAGSTPSPMTVRLPFSGYALPHSFAVERWSNAKLAGSPATASASGTSSAPSGTVTTVAPQSVVSWVNADSTAATGTRTYRSSATEETYRLVSGSLPYAGYWAWQQAASAGAQTIGLTAPASQKWALAGIEIQALNTGGLSDGQATTFDGLAFVAAPGKSVPDNTATGAAGGAVADCVIPAGGFAKRGGNGATGTTTGGGGGSGAGTDLDGADASGLTGGTAPAGGGNGGNGGAAGGNNPGGAGAAPSGAGAGAFSTGGTALGGVAAAGKVTLTYLAPLTPFKTLLVHAPGYDTPATFSPLVPAGGGQDVPDGREYPVPSPISGLNARYYGTYSVIVFLSNVDSPTSPRTITVNFRQYDYPGGPSTTRSVTRTLTPSTEDPVIVNGVVIIDTITLPCRDIADDQTAAYTTVGVTSTNSADRVLDVAVTDVTGQLLLLNVTSGSGYPNFWWDTPETDRDWGRILASTFDRAQAVSVMDFVLALSGGPLMVDPAGPGWLLVYSPDAGAPSLTAGFWARWRDSRLS